MSEFSERLSSPQPEEPGWQPPEPEELAQLLPQYRIESLIGCGGMAAVYRGTQANLDRPIAIKLLPAEMAADEEFVERFRREACTLAKLRHPGIVTIYESGQTSEGHLFFVMEFVDGADLHHVLHGPGIHPKQALIFTTQVCDALEYAHKHGVVHSDIKPGNILITREGRAKLVDFGLARPLNPNDAAASRNLVIMGTPDYAAPEQHAGVADPRSDLYALGVVLYEMLTGQPPRGGFEPPSQRAGGDVRIDPIVIKALQPEPAMRFQRASEMKAAIERLRIMPAQRRPSAAQPDVQGKGQGKVTLVTSLCVVILGAAGYFLHLGREGRLPMLVSSGVNLTSLPPKQVSPALPASLNGIPRGAEADFVSLCDEAHAGKWKLAGTLPITLQGGIVDTQSDRGSGWSVLWYAANKFADFSLRFDFKRDRHSGCNSGVFVRFEDPSGDPYAPDYSGYEIDFNGAQDTGAIVRYKLPTDVPENIGEWNGMEISVIGSHFCVTMNGRVVNDYDAGAFPSGYIGIQNCGGGLGVQFRNLCIKEWPVQASPVQQPRTLEEALLSFAWKIKSDGVNPRPEHSAFFLPDGNVKRARRVQGSWNWTQTGPLEFSLRVHDDPPILLRFTDASFRRIIGPGMDEKGEFIAERDIAIMPPAKIVAASRK